MTGYGKAELNLTNANFMVEVKSLNSKHLDINIKIPSIYRDQEIQLRQLISEKLKRGKIELSIWKEKEESNIKYKINTLVVKEYHSQVLELTHSLGLKSNGPDVSKSEILPILLKMPDALIKSEEQIKDNQWEEIEKTINSAINNLLDFRREEGKKLEKDIREHGSNIEEFLLPLNKLTQSRIIKTKTKIKTSLSSLGEKNVDKNRFEQELIYYLEKQDVNEEQVRLSAHLDYFFKTLKENSPNGKKLGFIAQEIGREINTIGSKASDAEMQRMIVQMKNELEKIKEQLLNVL